MMARSRTRPKMQHYGISTDDNGLMEWSWVQEQAEKSRNYWITSVRSDGSPHAAPNWGVWIDDVLYFATGRASVKARNLLRDPRVAVHLESGDDVVIFEGVVEFMPMDTAFISRFQGAYAAKYAYSPDPVSEPDNAYLQLVPRVTMAWLEKDFVNTATRWEIVT